MAPSATESASGCSFGLMRGHQYAEGATPDSVVARLRRIPTYAALFQAAFAEPVPVTATNVGKALACFKRTLVATNSPSNQYQRGTTAALIAQQVQGLQVFPQSGCGNCHSGPMLSDYQLHVMGVADNSKTGADKPAERGQGHGYHRRGPDVDFQGDAA